MVLVSLLNLITGDLGLVGFLSSPDLSILLNGVGLGTLRAGVAGKTWWRNTATTLKTDFGFAAHC